MDDMAVIVGLPRVYSNSPAGADRYGAAINDDFARAALYVEEQMPFAVCVRHHRAVHGIQADASERAMTHCNCFTHRTPIGAPSALVDRDYTGLNERGKLTHNRPKQCGYRRKADKNTPEKSQAARSRGDFG